MHLYAPSFLFWLKATEKVPTSGPTPAKLLTTAQHFFNQYLIQEVREVSIKGQGKDILFYKLDNSLNFMAGLLALKWRLLGIKVKWDGGILDNYPSDPGSYDFRPGLKILFH